MTTFLDHIQRNNRPNNNCNKILTNMLVNDDILEGNEGIFSRKFPESSSEIKHL